MHTNYFKNIWKTAALAVGILLFGAVAALAQQTVNLTAAGTSITMPDGSVVPMWGYFCGATVSASTATCRALNQSPAATTWSPVVITVPSGQPLTINLTNNLSFTPAGTGTTPNNIPTSLTIVGQVGGGLGSPTKVSGPNHVAQQVTWSTVGGGNTAGAQFFPPNQGPRVQSFATEVAAVPTGTGMPTALTWSYLAPGTYLLESGTHPSIQGPMGLIGMVVVTTAPTVTATAPFTETAAGTAYPGVSYDAEVPLLFSEIDPIQNAAVANAVSTQGFVETATIDPYLAAGQVLSIAVVNGGSGYTPSTTFPLTISGGGASSTTAATATATTDAFGQVISVNLTAPGSGYTSAPSVTLAAISGSGAAFIATMGGSALGTNEIAHCFNQGQSVPACYPPAVNYTPLYYLINGVGFSRTNAVGSLFLASNVIAATPSSGNPSGSVLVRLVNAGLRMHVPAIVNSQTIGFSGAGASATVGGFTLIAEDGNQVPGAPRVQTDVFMAAGKTYDVMINGNVAGGTATATALPVYDRELSLSGNKIDRDAGMLAYIGLNGALATSLPAPASLGTAVANPDNYPALVAGHTLTVSDPAKGVIANDFNVYGVHLLAPAANGTVTLNANGTFTYVPNTGSTATSDSFSYCANGSVTAGVCSSGITAMVTLGASALASDTVTCTAPPTFNAALATYLAIKTPGLLAYCTDANNLPLTIVTSSVTPATGLTVYGDANGGFTASTSAAGVYSFTFTAQNSVGKISSAVTAMINFPAASGLAVSVIDGYSKAAITDYRWIIEEDQTFYNNPVCLGNNPPTTCFNPQTAGGVLPLLGVNFHTSHMPYVALGCTGPKSCESGQTMVDNNPSSATYGQHIPAVCDVGNGVCRPDTTLSGKTLVMPSQVHLDPTKRYYISVLPGDAADPFAIGYSGSPNCTVSGDCGHGMGGAPIAVGQTAVTVVSQASPYPTAKLSVFVFEDDFPLNGEQDGGGGVDVLAPVEPGLGGFQIHLWDAMGGNGDFTGQMTYDMFNQPLTNSLDGSIDPATTLNACPITQQGQGITGMIVTCPKYESDGKTLSPLAGQAVVANLMPGRWGVIATPSADRIARGEEWLQTNTLDGQKAHDSFTRIGEPSYFQEFGPAGYHVSIGFANPAIINGRHTGVCSGNDPNITGTNCNNTLVGKVTGQRLSRTPDERLYSSGSHDTYYWTQCYVSFGDPDGEDFAFTKCNSDGTFKLTGLPDGNWRVTVFDQWNDELVDGLSTPVALFGGATGATTNLGDVSTTQWETNLYTKTCINDEHDGICHPTNAGIPFSNVAVRLRDGSLENLLVTDFTGTANFNETFPLFSWYTVETDTTRYKNTGTHVVYDVGGPADGSPSCSVAGYPPCGSSTIGKFLANTQEQVSVPDGTGGGPNLRVPGSIYCATADCTGYSIQGTGLSSAVSNCSGSGTTLACGTPSVSSGRIDNPWSGGVEGWQGYPGQNNFIEFGKEPYIQGENGGIHGHVVYASTRPFDDPYQLVQTQWTPLVPNVTMNLYQEGFAADGVTPTLTLVDTTVTSSWDAYAQGFHTDATGHTVPNMNCPGQFGSTGPNADLFFFTLSNQPEWLDYYNNVLHPGGTGSTTPLPYNSQFKCYDGMHSWNQLQPAPYDGMYKFPSLTAFDPTTGKPTAVGKFNGTAFTAGTNCKICIPDPVATPDLYAGVPMLPPGKYVVEVVLPPGYELVKEEDKNILIGDNFIAPVTQQFGGLANVFLMPDQASVAASQQTPGTGYNPNNAQNPTQAIGFSPTGGIVPGFLPEPTWPCVGEARVVPDYISLFPQTKQVAPFAGATRNLCDRKEVTLGDQMGASAKFWIFTSTHIASKFTGGITDDYTSEFDPFAPQFGEKFAPPDLPVSLKDWTGNEISRTYADHWGAYDGMTYSTWEVNPPNPTGYSPTMMVVCMNDPGPIPNPANSSQLITDPLFTQGYSQFCYELPFMPGTTQYLDTPVVPTSAFAGAGYNNVDCYYPDSTPAVREVDGDGVGPWASKSGVTLTIQALGDQLVPNNAYSGPAATTAPFNTKNINRHYGFGAQCTSPTPGNSTCNTLSRVTIGGKSATVTSWSDTSITVAVPSGIPNCAIQQQVQYGGSSAQCGQLVITAGNGKQSVDAVTVTVGGKTPTHVAAGASIQAAIDAAAPGDMIMIDPTCNTTAGPAPCPTANNPAFVYTTAAHNELLIMWKPVRLQGVGGATSIINANTQPAGKLDPWRRQVNCLFGLTLTGTPISGTNAYDPSGAFTCSATMQFQVDRLPLEAVIGWDATQNGNLAELLQEPALMGALEGAGITVLGKGVSFPAGSNPFSDGTEAGGFPTGTTLLLNVPGECTSGTNGANPYPSDFQCNPSSIDGLGITNSSQGGGGIFVHGWNHYLQIANNRIYNNAGTLSGGINLGQGEFPTAQIQGSATNAPPGSCLNSSTIAVNVQLPYCHNINLNVHNNAIYLNSSTGDELFSATLAGAGGVTICTGADYYKFNYNWICGNLSSGDGGGVAHMGFSYNGDIEHNSILFNQSINPTIPSNGGGLLVMGAPDVDPTNCGLQIDTDCVPAPGSGTADGVGPNLMINANLIMGNAAETGSGGGLRIQNANGTDVSTFPTDPTKWYQVNVTNNIIADNVSGWDGGGISLQDALNVNVVNNTIISNDTTASAGVLFTTIGAPISSAPPPGNGVGPEGDCFINGGTASCPQPAGLVAIRNSAALTGMLPSTTVPTVRCPAGHYDPAGPQNNGSCRSFSYPLLANNLFWQNSAYQIGVGPLTTTFQQKVISLYNAAYTGTSTGTLVGNQTATGQCLAASYWDIGVRGDTGPGQYATGNPILAPMYSSLTNTSEVGHGANNLTATAPSFVSQYCNGSRQPPEFGASGWAVPPGISDATVPNPIFNLTPVATVDEGNNWVNLRWGPLSLTNPSILSGGTGYNVPLGNFAMVSGSPAIDYIPTSSPTAALAPSTDFFGNPRPDPARTTAFDIGAVEYQGVETTAVVFVTGGPLAFGNVIVTTTSAPQTLTLRNNGGATMTGITVAVTASFARAGGSCGATLAGGATCTINVVFSPTAAGAATGTATITGSVTVNGSPVSLSGTGLAAIRTAGVSPSPLAFGNWATGTTSNPLALTVTNTGNVSLAGGTFTFGGGTPQPFSRPGGAAGGNCGATLAVGASCTINVQFAPATVTAFSRTLTVAYTGATVTPTPVSLTGTGVATRATVTITPNPFTITLPTGTFTGTGTVTLANSAAAGGSQVAITNVAVSGGTLLSYFFNKVLTAGADTCTGTNLAPGASCTVGVRFTNVLSPRGVNRAGTITFTDTATASPQSGALNGHANP